MRRIAAKPRSRWTPVVGLAQTRLPLAALIPVGHPDGGSAARRESEDRIHGERTISHDFGQMPVHASANNPPPLPLTLAPPRACSFGGAGRAGPARSETRLAAEVGHAGDEAGAGPTVSKEAGTAGTGPQATEARPASPEATTTGTVEANCSPRGLSRQDFLAQPGASQSLFGLTTLDTAQVVFPELNVARVRGGVQVQETTASLPSIPSVYTRAGSFFEGSTRVPGGEGVDCPEGRYPLRWNITPAGAERIRDGEREHCSDFAYAFEISVGRVHNEINQLAGSRRTFPNEPSVRNHLQRRIGFSFNSLPSVFRCLATRSVERDDPPNQWHTPHPLPSPPNRFNRCEYAMATINDRSLPHVGRHPTPDLIRDCGEAPPARPGSRGTRR